MRSLMGIGAALIMPATLSIIANVFPPEERGKAIGIWAALAAIGIGLGPLAGGVLIEWFDWSAVFLVNVPVALCAVLLGIRLVPESRDPKPGAFDIAGAALSTAGFTMLVYAIIEAPGDGWGSAPILALLAGALALLTAFVAWERHTAQPMLDLGFFRNARFSVGTVAVSVAFFSLLGGIFALTQYLQFAHGYSAIEAGAIMSPLALGLILGAGSSSRAVARIGTARVMAAARMVSGALGVAIVGSLVNSIYKSDVESSLHGLPAPARDAAGESIGAASAIAGHLPPAAGSSLLSSAGDAFVGAMGTGLVVAAALSAAAAVLVALVLPGRPAEHAARAHAGTEIIGHA
jgi:hypothetical protein